MQDTSVGNDFDPHNRDDWYFGTYSREDANRLLDSENEAGVFLVRDSNTLKGDLVLCVSEGDRTAHYIIQKYRKGESGDLVYRIGEKDFNDMPELLIFYRYHLLDKTYLKKVVTRERYITLYTFAGKDKEDLPFGKGEMLTILQKDEAQWWTAKNSKGEKGQVPVTYLQKHEPRITIYNELPNKEERLSRLQSRKVPFVAKAVKPYSPCVYNQNELAFEKGDTIQVEKVDSTGTWFGKKLPSGPSGEFPFIFVRPVDTESEASN
ncbi:DgyrCDS9609 [Dimorphilus gyrociliatus]|uniref:DgyrCDS9609 n=1 Tax=Dimorphilus gyrociliatus TaxID=2664684 RepID=A0A7I8VXH8_9ANNE|nr:DgyrCDS9609 [Dimorphilus gyrociliatus]